MESALFVELQRTLTSQGAGLAIEQLCERLDERKDYGSLFYALLLKKRHELGLSVVPTGASQDIPEECQGPYEDAIRAACQRVGRLFLDAGDIPRAWMYYRMIGEPQPVAEALDSAAPEEGEDVQQLVEIGYHHGVNPRRGFDLLLQHFGLCSAITTVSGGEFPHGNDVRVHCIGRLVRTLYDELYGRLEAEIVGREGSSPAEKTVRELLSGRDWLFEEEFYHVDVSHLSAVVQMSVFLPPGPELEMARELCEYGKHLSPRLQGSNDPPFENNYDDYAVYLAVLAGDKVEEGLAHFRAKLEADPEEAGTAPAEVLVNLLLSIDRPKEAVEVARQHLATVEAWRLSCPSFTELCQRAKAYQALADVAQAQGDPVHFLAGLIEDKKGKVRG